MSLERLHEYNPWWDDAAAMDRDGEISAWKESTIKWDPRMDVSYERGDSVYSLRGPRRVGKTTLLKLWIADLLESGVRPQSVMYYAFDLEERPTDVADIVCAYLDRVADRNEPRRFLFLDEISNVRNWQRAVKNLHDRRKLKDCTVVTTGSHLVDLRRSDELLPGRRGAPGDSLDKFLMPMSFGRYVAVMDPAMAPLVRGGLLSSVEGRVSALRALAEGREFDGLDRIALHHNELTLHLDMYLESGGMPVLADELARMRRIQPPTYKMHMRAVKSVMRSAGRDLQHADRVAGLIASRMGSAVSWSELGRDAGISHGAAEEHARALCDMMIAATLYRYDSAANSPKFDSAKKIYYRDPAFLHAFRAQSIRDDPYKSALKTLEDPTTKGLLVEQAVADCMLRLAEAVNPPGLEFEPAYSVMYWKSSKSKREVDFVLRDGESLIPVESKYQNAVRRDDLWGLADFEKATGQGGGIVVTRQDLRPGRRTLIPASVFLLLA